MMKRRFTTVEINDRLFPILVPSCILTRASIGQLAPGDSTVAIVCAIPWRLIQRHELNVRRHHRMGLTALAARGGLEAREVMAAIDGADCDSWPEANAKLHALMARGNRPYQARAAA